MRRAAALVLVALITLAACSSDDSGEGSGADGDPQSSTTSTAAADEAAFELTSPSFAEAGEIPVVQAGCDGANESPPLDWAGVPDGTGQLAVTMVDPDADGFVHWVVVGIDPGQAGLDAGVVPAGAVEALNDTGQPGYFGPCPPETHTYVFTLHALSGDPAVDAGSSGPDAIAAVEAVTSTSTELTGTYTPAS